MAAPNRGIAAGAQYSFLGFYDSNGFLTGGTPTAPTNADASGNPFAHILGIKEASPTVPTPDEVVIDGDDTRLGSFSFDSIAPRAFEIQVAAFNLQQEADLLGTNVESVAGMKLGVLDIVDRQERDSCLILQGRSKKQDAGTKGIAAWEGLFIPLATVIPLHRQAFSSRTGAVYRLHVTPQVASHRPWGITLSDGLAGTVGGTYMPFSSDNPIHIHVFSGDGIVTSWNLKHRPVDVASSAAFADRVGLGITSVSRTSPYPMVLSGAVRTSGRIAVVYQFDQFVE